MPMAVPPDLYLGPMALGLPFVFVKTSRVSA